MQKRGGGTQQRQPARPTMKAPTVSAMLAGLGEGMQPQLNTAFELEDVMFFRRTAEDELLFTRWRSRTTRRVEAQWVRVDIMNTLQQYHKWLAEHDLHHLHAAMRRFQLGTGDMVMRSVRSVCADADGVDVYPHYIRPREDYLPMVCQ